MTPEQREMVASHVADTVATHPWGAAIRACLAAAGRATDPQAEADRRLGAKVRNSAPLSFDLPTTLTEAARELDAVQFPVAAGALRAIAAALREEEGR